MNAQIFIDHRSGFKYTMLVGERGNDDIWRYVESVMPEENVADWAEKFWDSAYVALHKSA